MIEYIEFKVEVNKIVSSNNHLAARVKKLGIKCIPYLSLTDQAKTFKKEVSNYLKVNYNINKLFDKEDIISFFNSKNGFKTKVNFYIQENRLFSCDLSNLKKLGEDCIVEHLKSFKINFDDSKIVKSKDEKMPLVDNSKEIFVYRLERCE